MKSFEYRQLQLETNPNYRTSGRLVNPDRDKMFHFSENFQIKNLVSIVILHLGFFSERQQVKSYFPPHVVSQLHPDRDKIFGFSGSKNFWRASGSTTFAAHGFKFGALTNLQAPTASFTAPYSHEASYQA